MNNYYLLNMGIQSWSLRCTKPQGSFYYYCLRQVDQPVGFLLVDDVEQEFQQNLKIQQFISEMLNAISLTLDEENHVFTGEIEQLQAACVILAMGSWVTCFTVENLAHVPRVMSTQSPQYYLRSPLNKKELWWKIRNFT